MVLTALMRGGNGHSNVDIYGGRSHIYIYSYSFGLYIYFFLCVNYPLNSKMVKCWNTFHDYLLELSQTRN